MGVVRRTHDSNTRPTPARSTELTKERRVSWSDRQQRNAVRKSRELLICDALFAKNYLAVGFKLDYVKSDGDLSNYTPDFIVRTIDGKIWIVETKGREELDHPQKMARLKEWCADATAAEENGMQYDFVFVDQISFNK